MFWVGARMGSHYMQRQSGNVVKVPHPTKEVRVRVELSSFSAYQWAWVCVRAPLCARLLVPSLARVRWYACVSHRDLCRSLVCDYWIDFYV